MASVVLLSDPARARKLNGFRLQPAMHRTRGRCLGGVLIGEGEQALDHGLGVYVGRHVELRFEQFVDPSNGDTALLPTTQRCVAPITVGPRSRPAS